MMSGMSLDPAAGLLIVLGVALLFARAAIHKLRDLAQFEEIFAAYGLLPALARPAAPALPVLELGTAAALLHPATRSYGIAIALLLLATYALAIAVNLQRGREHIACGCGAPDERTRIAPWMVVRNLIIAAALATTLLPAWTRPWSFTDGVTVSFGLATLALLYQCVEQLMTHWQRRVLPGASR
jgi:hypothetical protein